MFALENQFFEAKVEGCVLFGEATVNEVTFLAFEVVTKTSVSNTDTDNHAYKNAETMKLRGMFDTRKRVGDRHKTPREGDRHLDQKDRHKMDFHPLGL